MFQNFPQLSDGRVRFSAEKATLNRATLYSHDWTDPTTWYTTAVYYEGEQATDTGDHTTYALAHTNAIDTYHGKITGEDNLKDPEGRSYRVAVYVDGIKKTEQDPHYGAGGDYTINYALGQITFLVAQAPAAVVTCDYHAMVDSTFIIAPQPGRDLRIDFAEVQFTLDVDIKDSVVFQPYGLVEAFAPQLVEAGMVPAGTKIPLGPPLIYKGISDYQNDAVRAYPTYPAMGGAGWRGMPQPMIIIDWDYQSATLLESSKGMEIQLKLQHDEPFGGYYATATFYCVVEQPLGG